eukprot:359849-Chlamydomonas_euryale.AAC.3
MEALLEICSCKPEITAECGRPYQSCVLRKRPYKRMSAPRALLTAAQMLGDWHWSLRAVWCCLRAFLDRSQTTHGARLW